MTDIGIGLPGGAHLPVPKQILVRWAYIILLAPGGLSPAQAQDWKPSPAPSVSFQALQDNGRIQSALPHFDSLTHGGLVRTFSYYVPYNLPPTPIPVVVVLHGGGNDGLFTQYASHEGRWNELADNHKLIILYPDGRPSPVEPSKHHWNDCRNDDTDPTSHSDEDDVGFVAALLDWISTRYSIDPSRCYATGPSNGGMMTYRLAGELSHRIAAAAAVVANMPRSSECPEPGAAMPMLIMNGTDDPLMPYAGGCIGPCSAGGGEVRSFDETVAYWTNVNAIVTHPTIAELPDIDTSDNCTVTLYTYTNTVTGSEVLVYKVNGGGHRIPGTIEVEMGSLFVGNKNRDIRAPDEIWKFFSRHVKSGGF